MKRRKFYKSLATPAITHINWNEIIWAPVDLRDDSREFSRYRKPPKDVLINTVGFTGRFYHPKGGTYPLFWVHAMSDLDRKRLREFNPWLVMVVEAKSRSGGWWEYCRALPPGMTKHLYKETTRLSRLIKRTERMGTLTPWLL